MGNVFSGPKARTRGKGRGEEYERALQELDSQISSNEIALAELRVAERKMSVYLFIYGLVIVMLGYLFIFFRPRHTRSVLDLVLLLALPTLSYYLRKTAVYYYRRKVLALEDTLQTLRAKQKLKIEELKEQTAYYQTRGLIERFDPDLRQGQTRAQPQPLVPAMAIPGCLILVGT